jgi:hypothetical protein
MAGARVTSVNRVASGGLTREMWQQLFGKLKLTVGAILFAGIAGLTVWRLLG